MGLRPKGSAITRFNASSDLSIFNFMIKGVTIYWVMIGVELVGIFIGSMIGPRTGKYIPEKGLKWFFILLAIYVGLDYTLRGFFNYRIFG